MVSFIHVLSGIERCVEYILYSYIKNVSVWDPTAHFKHC